ncbi:ferritin-like domain-containing protein [Paracoccus aestuariivivens]|uniref:DUF892 family protein n=1 Tax=Paracoccus aestuariivivens TaxID=1820333 RepID=A0A6L6JIG6_9RHOB|nr:ferritin-like domain-containing protein [Paracoccus aestuariivivens]MTH79914.1 DUF892 family protein [Paracoccus aestuariivivens]
MATQPSTKSNSRKTARSQGRASAKSSREQRSKRAQNVARKSASTESKRPRSSQKTLSDLLEHGLKDMYYAEKKIYRALPKMIRKADHPELKEALENHRAETESQIETLENVFELLGKRARGEKCEAIDGILEEGESLLEDFGDSVASDAAIIFSCQAVEHYEITRYGSLRAFAEELGLEEIRDHLDAILAQEKAADGTLNELAEGSINDAASEYDAEEESALS